MFDSYGGGGQKKYIPKSQIKKIKKKMQKSFENADILAERLERIKIKEEKEADLDLQSQLNDI